VWLIENLVDFQKVGFKSVDIVDIAALPESNWKARFQSADIICFGGGNEQYLATVFDSLNMKAFLETNLEGKVYMGISAGSMVAGQFIGPELMSIVYPEEVFTEKGNPLGFVNFNFIPHLNSEWFTHVRKETLESIKPKFANKVCATDDETALKIVDDTVEIVGEGESWIS
jgi:dipeptidase E